MAVAFVAVGANIEPQKNIRAALEILCGRTRVVASSTFYRTAPLGGRDQPAYLNGVWLLETELPAADVKPALLAPVERQLGRARTGDKYAPRTIDLDLILYDDLARQDREPRLPHPDLLRPFVYFPVVELLGGMSCASFGDLPQRIRRLLPQAPASPPGEPLPEFTRELRALLES
jgi:2-amino-4-hydroxy-6-hydroxymethyldihydropteridine diphosphokinase